MSRIRGKNTKPERLVFRELRRRGVYFARHAKQLPGRPDVVFRNGKVAVFIDGDFWHGFRFPRWEYKLTPFWREKIAGNRARDQRNFARLRRSGWRVVRLWEHQVTKDVEACVDRVLEVLEKRRAEG